MTKKHFILTLLILLMVGVNNTFAQLSFGNATKLNDGWSFMLGAPDDAKKADYKERRWQKVELPHDWSVEGQLSPSLSSCTGYLPGGIGWYRKNLDIAKEQSGKKLYLYFEGVYNRSEIYINGELVGKRPNGYVSAAYDITDFVKFGESNLIAVKVDHSKTADSRWYTGSGIYRNVWLVDANPLHIAQWGVFAYPKNVSSKSAAVVVEVELQNESDKDENITVVNELVSPSGEVVAKQSSKSSLKKGESSKLMAELKVNKPALWSIKTPNLYTLNTTILKGKEVIDIATTKTGIRNFTFDANKGFALNGEWMKMKGVCVHHDGGVLGSAVPREVWQRRLLNLKSIGVNAIRTSHNPQATDLYDLCDELGLLVLNEAYDEWEFPKRKWVEGWNKGTPAFQGAFDFFEEWGEKDLADMVRRDRNHASIFGWSIGNEVDYPNDPYSHPVLDGGSATGFTQPIFGGYKKEAPDAMRLGAIAKRLAKVVRTYDPTRAVTAGLAGVAMSNETEYPAALDVAGYNYTESMYDSDHKKYPNRVIYGSENRHDLEAWKATRDKEFVFGQFLWTGIDYLGESGAWPSRGFYSGLLDFGGFIKPRGYFRASLWSETPMAYLGTYPTPGKGGNSAQAKDVWMQLEGESTGRSYEEKTPSMDAWPVWNYTNGQSIRVVCYTTAPKAKLLLNGKEVGEIKEKNDEHGIIFWDIPYSSGKLEVVAMDANQNKVADYAITSSKAPYKIVAKSDKSEISKDGEVAQITLEVVDENGVRVMLSDNEIKCLIGGNARLLGMEASNNSDMSDYTDNIHRVYNGQMLIYVKSNGKIGDINLLFSSPWLESAHLKLKSI